MSHATPATGGSAVWFPRGTRSDAALRLLCFPHAGAGATAFATWSRWLPPEVGVHAAQLPGREARFREPPCRDVRRLVRDMLPAVAALADRPVLLFGHSLGALIAFEVVRGMRRAGLPAPAHLYVSGRGAPQIPTGRAPARELTDDALVERLRAMGGTPGAVLDDPDVRALFLPALRADFEMNEGYEPSAEAALDVPVTAFAATQDPWAPPDDVAAWGAQTTRRFVLRPVDGGHFAVPTSPRLVIDEIVADVSELGGAVSPAAPAAPPRRTPDAGGRSRAR